MKILLVTHHTWAKSFARPFPIAEHLANAGHDVTLICTSDKNRMRWHEDVIDGVRVLHAPDLLWGRLRSGWDMWATIRKFVWMKRRLGEFDIVHLFETRPSVIIPFRLARGAMRGPVAIDWNDWWSGEGGIIDSLRPGWYRKTFGLIEGWFENYYRDSADGSTAISSALFQRILALDVDPKSVVRLTGGTRPDSFKAKSVVECRKEIGITHDDPIIGFSSLDSHIDLELVLNALAILAKKFPKISLLVTGRPSDVLMHLAQDRGLEERIYQSGFVPFESLTTYLGAANICVLPLPDTTYNRGRWPNKITDYATAGRPTVTNPVGDMGDLVTEHDMGLLTEWDDNAFASAIESLLADSEEADRLGRNARIAAETSMTWTNQIAGLETFYEKLIDQHPDK